MLKSGKISNYTIVGNNPDYQQSIAKLPQSILVELETIIELLKDDPFPPKQGAKELNGFSDVYKIRLGNQRYRLVYRVDINSHKVFLRWVKIRNSLTYAEYR